MEKGIRSISLSETQVGAVIEAWLAAEVLRRRQPVVGLDWCDGFLNVELGEPVADGAVGRGVTVVTDVSPTVKRAAIKAAVAQQIEAAGTRLGPKKTREDGAAYTRVMRVTDEQMAEMKRLLQSGHKTNEIAERVGLGESTVSRKLKLIREALRSEVGEVEAEAVHVAEPVPAPFRSASGNGSNGSSSH